VNSGDYRGNIANAVTLNNLKDIITSSTLDAS
jgi:hypothetical protein